MKPVIATAFVLLVSALFAGPVCAHGKVQHVLGTVQKISDESLTVQTTKGETVAVMLASDTRYLKGGEPATLKDLKVGERVAIEADAHGAHVMAKVVKFGTPQKAP